MRFSWKIGRVAGIDLYLHSTFLLMLAFIGLSRGGVPAIATASALFACVLLHELGHALTARQFGIPTEDITLYPIGGVARLRRLPRSPGAELLIALAGPAVNVVIAGVIWAGLGLAIPALGPAALDAYPARLAGELLFINLVLAGFNLLPAFPMDGGRALRALLSQPLGRLRATEIAAALGQALALVFGLYCLFNGLLVQMILALFIFLAAGSELRHVRAEEARRGHSSRVADPTQPPPGYLWIDRGNGVWQLSPVGVHGDDPSDFSAGRHRPWL